MKIFRMEINNTISIWELSNLFKDKYLSFLMIKLCNWIRELSIGIIYLFNTIR